MTALKKSNVRKNQETNQNPSRIIKDDKRSHCAPDDYKTESYK
jgi:hypothetical protein